LSLALLAGLGAVAAAQEAPPNPPRQQTGGNWFTNLWPFGQPAKKAEPKAAPKPPPVDTLTLRKGVWAAYWRRMDVCEKLLEIARANGDSELERRAEQLRQEVLQAHLQRLAQLPVGVDDTALAGRLNPGDTAGRLTAAPDGRTPANALSQAPNREGSR
jgi:hypothetical protein